MKVAVKTLKNSSVKEALAGLSVTPGLPFFPEQQRMWNIWARIKRFKFQEGWLSIAGVTPYLKEK